MITYERAIHARAFAFDGATQEEIANELECSQSTVSRLIREGPIVPDEVRAFCEKRTLMLDWITEELQQSSGTRDMEAKADRMVSAVAALEKQYGDAVHQRSRMPEFVRFIDNPRSCRTTSEMQNFLDSTGTASYGATRIRRVLHSWFVRESSDHEAWAKLANLSRYQANLPVRLRNLTKELNNVVLKLDSLAQWGEQPDEDETAAQLESKRSS